ncbi:MAG: hypothetical protein ABIR91_00645, partial [Candidatus Saccharimonadales bacterium]
MAKRSIWRVAAYGLVALLVSNYPVMTVAAAESSTNQPASVAAPPPPPKPTYDSDSGRWSTSKWQYNPTAGVYEAVVVSPPPKLDIVT